MHAVIAKAEKMKLAEHAGWYDLLHYKPQMLSGFYSQVDDEAFFLSKSGKQDAHAELLATIKAMFSLKDEQHPQCLFPARLYWLNEQLNFAESLPAVNCTKFDSWKEKIDAESVTMLFPSMYLHNPGSMFGHTFLRLNKKDNADLLNYTLSYAANHDPDDSMLSYVYKGISGGYLGVFSVQPYYETVQSYGDVEQRDIWEYSLNLNQAEVDQLVRHIWEVSSLDYDYYFFRENCSYRLLSLLDVARPGLNITRDHHFLYAIPVDTVRSSRSASLIKSEIYRPARSARIEQMFGQMNNVLQQKTLDVLASHDFDLTDFVESEQIKILDTAHEISQLDKNQDDLSEKILSRRSQIKLENDENLPIYKAQRPDDGHDSARWNLAYGKKASNQYTEIGLRPSFHDLLDREQGFVKGTAITVLDTRIRWYEIQQRLQLEYLSFFSMTSLSPIKPWERPLSGRLNLSVQREAVSAQQDGKVFNIDTALGYSFELANNIFYGLADSQFSYTKKYAHSYVFSLGAEIGALILFDNSRMQFKSRFLYDVAGEARDKEKHEWRYQYDINKNHALRWVFSITKSTLQNTQLREQDTQINYLMYF